VRLVHRGRRDWASVTFMLVLALVAALAAQTSPVSSTPQPTATAMPHPVVTIKTSLGSVEVELFPDKAPKTVENFLTYVKAGHYDGSVFHRVIAGFMVQGGGFDKAMTKKSTRAPVVNEAGNGLKNLTGTIAMARTSDPDSATAQFFINVADNESLNRATGNAGYTVFGKVIAGLDVVKKLEAAPTSTQNGMRDVPVTQLVIESVRLK
jgi:peptidyl-prolyl cis-trans isomerase A (cyclophilin A)